MTSHLSVCALAGTPTEAVWPGREAVVEHQVEEQEMVSNLSAFKVSKQSIYKFV